jgi:hypothetical protein
MKIKLYFAETVQLYIKDVVREMLTLSHGTRLVVELLGTIYIHYRGTKLLLTPN